MAAALATGKTCKAKIGESSRQVSSSSSVEPIHGVVDTFKKIESSFKILQEINTSHVTLSDTFLTPLYKNTALERKSLVNSSSRRQETESDNAILRKNLYFLAQNLRNSTHVIIQLTQRGLLSLDEKDQIMHFEEEYLKALQIFVYTIGKNPKLYSQFLDALAATENNFIVSALKDNSKESSSEELETISIAIETAAVAPNYSKSYSNSNMSFEELPFHDAAAAASPSDEEHDEDDGASKWECKNCTFINNTSKSVNICQICYKTKDFETITMNTALECPQCTFINIIGQTSCEICGFLIVPEKVEQVDGDSDEWFDD